MSSNSSYLTGIPSTPNTVADSWQPAVDQIDTAKKGFNAVSLDDWDGSTTAPAVLAGSEIEAAGGIVRVATDEAILDDPGGLASGTIYLVVDFSGSDPEWYWTNDAPVWNPSLNGFYDAASGSVNWRYTGHQCVWDGSTSYSVKSEFISGQQTGDQMKTPVSIAGTYGTVSIAAGGTWLIPAGAYIIRTIATSGSFTVTVALQIYTGSTWTTSSGVNVDPAFSGLIISDGTNYRLKEVLGSAGGTIHYRRLW